MYAIRSYYGSQAQVGVSQWEVTVKHKSFMARLPAATLLAIVLSCLTATAARAQEGITLNYANADVRDVSYNFV